MFDDIDEKGYPTTHMSEDPLLDGFQAHRAINNWREFALVELWKAFQQRYMSSDFLTVLFWNSKEFRSLSLEEQIAAKRGFTTAIQWLGTNVGFSFLRESCREIGTEITEVSLIEKLTKSMEEGQEAKRILENIQRWKIATKD
jgi:hypothetical protein